MRTAWPVAFQCYAYDPLHNMIKAGIDMVRAEIPEEVLASIEENADEFPHAQHWIKGIVCTTWRRHHETWTFSEP